MSYRGLTWDHPRGYAALEAAAAQDSNLDLTWERQPLEEFESSPIAELCAEYDLVVLDHPHIGEAVAAGCLTPLEEIFTAEELQGFAENAIGPSFTSYCYAGKSWALPLDAASQVMAYRSEQITTPPITWQEVCDLPADIPVGLSLSGPHAMLSFQSIAASITPDYARHREEYFVDSATGKTAYHILQNLYERTPDFCHDLNPIGLLERMSSSNDLALCPLIYGYVNYASEVSPVTFIDAPRWKKDGRAGSTLGGTGISISSKCDITPELLKHLKWLMSDQTQSRFIPEHQGQPSSKNAAWLSDKVNASSGDFYKNTADTLSNAYVRPRFDGAIAFQTKASSFLNIALETKIPADVVVTGLNQLFNKFHPKGTEC